MAIVWGANGHPFVAYGGVSDTGELDLVQSTGLREYRVDIYNADTGSRNLLSTLITAGATRGIRIQPCIVPHPEAFASEAAAYSAMFTLAQTYATQFTGLLWECGNELDLECIKRDPDPSGALPSDYSDTPVPDHADYPRCRGCINGLIDGIKSADATARVAVGNAGWHHYGFQRRLWADGVRWDVSVAHWYSDQGSITSVGGGGTNHLQILRDEFGKPIMVTEVNARPLTMASRQAEADWLVATMADWNSIGATYGLFAAHIYELLDEPEKAAANPPEAIYGLYGSTGTIKPMGTTVQSFLTASPSADPFADPETPFVDRSTTSSALTTFRPQIQPGVVGGITIQKIHAMIDSLEEVTTQATTTKTANYTAATADNRRRIVFNSASNLTLTVPNSLPVNWECSVVQLGTGTVTFTAATGGAATIVSRDGHTKTAGQYAQAYLTVLSNANGTAAQILLTGDTST